MAAAARTASAPRGGRRGGVIGLAAVLVALLAAAAVGLTAAANYRKSKKLTFHVFSARWWSVGGQEAAPAVDKLKETVDRWDVGLWGDNGLLDSAEDLLKRGQERLAGTTPEPAKPEPPPVPTATKPPPAAKPPPPKPPGKPAPPPKPVASSETQRLAQRLFEAEAAFRAGYEAYKRADPSRSALTDERKRNINLAKAQFRVVRDILVDALPRYVKQGDHDRKLADDARELDKVNLRLLENTNKMSGGL